MNIGCGCISIYHSIRYNLFFDKTTNSVYFYDSEGRKYIVKLNHEYITHIENNHKIWITLTKQLPSLIGPNFIINENETIIQII